MRKNILHITIFLLILALEVKAQKSYQLDAPVPPNVLSQRNGIIVARDYIQLKPGFTTATGPVNLRIDEKLICDLNYQTQVNPDNRDLDKNLAVGSINGVSDVTGTGGATYAIPIQISPGIQGIQPQLSIVYNSQGANGILGKGWDISGLSAIIRAPKNFLIDGETGGINLDQNDRFSLDGNRLLASTGTYGNQGTTYETYNKTFSKIETPVYSNSFYFKVTTKEGKVIEYGSTADSRTIPAGGANVFAWKISKMTDPSGNYMTFTYKNEDGESVIDRIDYTGNTNAGLQPYNQIQFYYERKSEKPKFYVAGASVIQSLLLNKIKIICEEKTAWTYNFTYSSNFYKEAQLNKITETDKDGKEKNSTIIGWSGLASTLYDSYEANFFDNKTFFGGDFNGDGRTDYLVIPYKYDGIYSSSDIWELYLTDITGKSFSKVDYGNLSNLFKGIEVADRNNDGTMDVLFKYKEHIQYECNCRPAGSTLTKQKVSEANTLNIIPPDDPGEICDICGYDQLAFKVYSLINNKLVKSSDDLDITITNPKTYSYYTLDADFNGDGKTDFLIIDENKNYYSTRGFPNSSVLNFNSPQKIDIIDFNGDGKKDILVVKDDNCIIYTYNQSSQSFSAIYNYGFPTKNHRIFLADFNSDGKTDLLTWYNSRWNISYSTGVGFTTANSPITKTIDPDLSSTDYNYITLDFNGDGRTDILESYHSPSYLIINIFYSYGDGFVKDSFTDAGLDWILTGKTNYEKFDDLNGDGRADILMHRGNGIPDHILTFHPLELPGLVEKISDGNNNKVVFQYSSLATSGAPYTKGTGAQFPVNDIQSPYYVVKALTTPNGIGGVTTTNYTYSGAKIHRQGLGFMGFTLFKAANTVADREISTTTAFNAFNHRVESQSIQVKSSLGAISTSVTTITNQKIGKAWFSYPSKIVETDNLSGVIVTTTTDYAGDILGNISTVTKEYGTGYSEVTKYENYLAAGSWIKNKPTLITVTRKHPDDANSFSSQTAFSFDPTTGNLTSKIENNSLTEKLVTTTYGTYDSFGHPLLVTLNASSEGGDVNNEKKYAYESKGRFIESFDDGITITKYLYDPIYGNLLNERNETLKIETNFSYDSWGNLVKRIEPNGITTNYAINWVDGNVPANALYVSSTTSTGNPGLNTWFDCLGRIVKEETIDRVNGYVAKEYKNTGELYKVSNYLGGALVNQITYTYYADGRVKSETHNSGKVVSYKYSENTVETTDDGKTYTKVYDNWGNLKSVSEPSPGGTISYKYKSNGKPFEIVSPKSTITIGYDQLGYQTSLADPDAGNLTYRYDALGRITYQKDGRGNEYTMEYDNYSRIISKTGPNSEETTYEYVSSGNGIGQLFKITASNDSYESFGYDQLGRVISSTKHIDSSNEVTFQTNYNGNGKVNQIIYPGNYTITHGYDSYGNLETISDGKVNIWTLNELTATKTKYTLGNGQVTEKIFNSFGLLNTIKTTNGVTEAQRLVYYFDPVNGLLKSREDQRTGYMLKESFKYDDLYRLTEWDVSKNGTLSAAYNLTYKTDASGNIDNKSGIGTYNYETDRPHAINNLVTASNSPVSLNDQNISYYEFNKVKQIVENGYKLNFAYGPHEERIKTELYQNNNLIRTIYYAGLYEKKIEGSNTTEYLYIPAGDGLAAVLIKTNSSSGVLNYIHKDHLGSITCITDANGNIKEQYNYDPWGRRRNPSDWSFNNVPAPTILLRGFTGHEHLNEFALINMNGRVYDPVLGMFLSPDNFVQAPDFSQNFNRYSYCYNNPLIYTDPDGQFIHIIIGAAIGGVVNLGIKAFQGKIHNFWDGVAAFGVGAAAGAVGAATGGAAFAAMGGTAGGVGGFIAGAGGGMVGSAASMPIQSIGNTIYFGDPLMTGEEFLKGVVIGGALGGSVNGVIALRNGLTFWDGRLPNPGRIPLRLPIPEPNPQIRLPNNGKATPLSMPEETPRLMTTWDPNAAAKTGGQTVYRAVDATEAAIIKSTGKFSLQQGGVEVKYFAKTLEDAHQYGQWIYKDGYSIIQGTVKGPLNINKFWYPNVDIGAYIFPREVLPYIVPK